MVPTARTHNCQSALVGRRTCGRTDALKVDAQQLGGLFVALVVDKVADEAQNQVGHGAVSPAAHLHRYNARSVAPVGTRTRLTYAIEPCQVLEPNLQRVVIALGGQQPRLVRLCRVDAQ
jgi:hypothetical protein